MTKHSFNLVDEKWIPCVMKDGTPAELGLLDTLAQAHEIHEIFDPSPLVCAALHRLMLALLHRNFGPSSVGKWAGLWGNGRFDNSIIQSYFNQWRDRFDLFHELYPFYQAANFTLGKTTPLKRLPFEYAAQNNPTLFDHSVDDARTPVAAKTAALWLLANQTFAPTAGKSGTIHTKDSPWSRGAVVLLEGDNLFDTLMLNLIPTSKVPEEFGGMGIPTWELETKLQPQHGVIPKGYLDYLTVQSRTIRLLPYRSDTGTILVSECYYAQGLSVVESLKSDPLLAYKLDEEKGSRPWQLREGRAVWRDSSSLMQFTASHQQKISFRPPLSISLAGQALQMGILEQKQVCRLLILGQCLEPGQPTIHFWRRERLPLPLRYLTDEKLIHDLQVALTGAELASRSLWDAVKSLAKEVISPKNAKPDPNQVKKYVDHVGTDQLYWSQLELPFHECLKDLPEKDRVKVLDAWNAALRRACWNAFEAATRDMDQSARTLQALVTARGVLGYRLNEVFRKINGREEMHAGK